MGNNHSKDLGTATDQSTSSDIAMDKETFSLDEKHYEEALQSYEKSTFYPEDILQECPKFRILIIGQAGAGKTTICSKVFHVSEKNGRVNEPGDSGLKISPHGRGTQMHQVWKGITFPGENEDIILHDSGGFEAANETGFEEIRKFLKDRLARTSLAEQLHCIWYCIPLLGHRHIQSAEEKFFKEVDVGSIPVIAVFTHFDALENDHEFTLIKRHQREYPGTPIPSDVPERAHALAVRDYDERERPALERIIGPHSHVAIRRVALPPDDPSDSHGVHDLINVTFDMLTKHGSLRRLWTAAQKQDADLKRKESIKISIEYLSKVNLSSSIPLVPFLGGGMFASSFNKMLNLMIQEWRLIDPEGVLQTNSARRRFFEACLKVSAAGRVGVKTGMALNFLGPFTAPLIAIALLKTAVGLIMMFDSLFWKQRNEKGLHLTVDVVRDITKAFSASETRRVAAAHIDGAVEGFNCYNQEICHDILETALRLGLETEAWRQKQMTSGLEQAQRYSSPHSR